MVRQTHADLAVMQACRDGNAAQENGCRGAKPKGLLGCLVASI